MLRVGEYEAVRYLVVSRQNGKSFELEAEPHLSPDGKRFAVVAVDELNGWEKDVAIYSTASFPPPLEWSYLTQKPDGWVTYSFLSWDGNARIKLRASDDHDKKSETDVTRASGAWKIRLPNGEIRMGVSGATK